MVKKLDFYQELAREELDAHKDRDIMLRAMDHMFFSRWELPFEVEKLDWMNKVVSTDPHDAVRAGTRVLSTVQPRLKIQPAGPHPDERKKTDKMERSLVQHFKDSSRRSRADILADIVQSAILYDEVVAQVVYLPHQIKELDAFKGNTKKLQLSRRFGPYAIILRNPKDVYVRYSDYMVESVLMRRIERLHETINFWGDKAKELKRRSQFKKNIDMDWVTIYEYMDLDSRVVWATLQKDETSHTLPTSTDAVTILKEDHDIPFLPWIARAGGSNLFPDQERLPMLFSVFNSNQWEIQNIMETIMMSEIVAYAGAPRMKIVGPTDNVNIDYGDVNRPVHVPPGHDVAEMQPPQFDQNMATMSDRIAQRMAKSTIPNVIQTGDFPSGTAFATLNLATQSGVKALAPYKRLAELAVGDIFRHMLYWIDFAADETGITNFVTERRAPIFPGQPQDAPPIVDEAEQITIKPGDFAVDNLFLEVELTADVPTDRMARINAASIANQQLGLSKRSGLESTGVNDPQKEMDESKTERDALVDEQIEQKAKEMTILTAVQGEANRIEAAKNFELEQQMAQAAQGGGEEAPPGPAGETNQNQRTQGKFAPRERGQGFNPAQGGSPPAIAEEGTGTREAVQGRTFTGEETG